MIQNFVVYSMKTELEIRQLKFHISHISISYLEPFSGWLINSFDRALLKI